MSTEDDYILPDGATALERSLAAVGQRTDAIGADFTAYLDPWRAPARFLPALAHAFSVDIWNPNWPEHKQRRVVGDAIRHHRLKGSLAGLEAYAEIVDAEIVRAIRPPGTFFLSGGLSDAQRTALYELMPQVRIYRRAPRASAGRRMFLTARHFSAIGATFVADSKATERSQPRITLFERGRETPIAVEEVENIVPGIGRALFERALLRRPRRTGVTYLGKRWTFWTTLDPSRSVAAFRRVTGAPRAIRYGMAPASVDPEPFFTRSEAGRSMFFGRPLHSRYFCDTRSDTRSGERIVIWDPDVVPRRRGASYLGVSRFGVDPFTAELVVHIPSTRARRSLFVGGFLSSFFVQSDGERFREAMRALRAARSARDQIFVNTKTFRSPAAGQLIVAGTPFIAGRLLRS